MKTTKRIISLLLTCVLLWGLLPTAPATVVLAATSGD